MKREYDFSSSVPNRHLKAVKKGVHIRLDQDVIDWLKAEALEHDIGYQTLANAILRNAMTAKSVSPNFDERLERIERKIFGKKKRA